MEKSSTWETASQEENKCLGCAWMGLQQVSQNTKVVLVNHFNFCFRQEQTTHPREKNWQGIGLLKFQTSNQVSTVTSGRTSKQICCQRFSVCCKSIQYMGDVTSTRTPLYTNMICFIREPNVFSSNLNWIIEDKLVCILVNCQQLGLVRAETYVVLGTVIEGQVENVAEIMKTV